MAANIDILTWSQALDRIQAWGRTGASRYVCIANAHSIISARRDPIFGAAIQNADMTTADGAPVAWMLRRQGFARQERINGPDLMWKYCALAERDGEAMYFYGSTPATLQRLRDSLKRAFPNLKIAGMESPPFRELTAAEEDSTISKINVSGAGTVWVGLGCPKQEIWMAAHRGRINAVMIGVGAAFDYHAGTLARAPLWMQSSGLEWLYRLAKEPRRLWRRYLVTNALFVLGATRQLISMKRR